jgi:hypothetical protein
MMAYTHIWNFGQAYFHQDYDLDADTPLGIVERFCDSEEFYAVENLRNEIVRLIESNPSEEDLSKIWVEDANAAYDPRDDGITLREWFLDIVRTISGYGEAREASDD